MYLDPNNPDTDGDGIPDGNEIALKIQIVDWDSAHNPIYGLTGYIFRSNPLSTDSDRDGYFDEIDPHPFTVDAMYINDRALNDDGFHNGSAITEKTSGSYTDGKFVADQDNGTAKYVFNRDSNRDHYFTLTPEKESFYKFSGATDLEVTYQKTILLAVTKTLKVTPEPNGTYILKGGTKYTIKAKCPNGKFTVEQDNWVYAPDGGKWTAGPNKYSAVMEQMYIPSDKLIAAVKSQSLGWAGVDNSQSVEAQVETVMRELKLDDSDKAFRDSVVSLAMSLAGGSYLVKFIAVPTMGKLVGFLLGDGTTAYFLLNDASTIFEYLDAKEFRDACERGKFNVIAYKVDRVSSPTWDPWTTNGYINKYYRSGNNFCIKGTILKNPSLQEIIDYCNF